MNTEIKYKQIKELLDEKMELDKQILSALEVFKEDFLVIQKVESILFQHLGSHTFTKCKVCIFMLLVMFMTEIATGNIQVEFNLKEMSKQFNIGITKLKNYISDGLDLDYTEVKVKGNKAIVKMLPITSNN